MKPFDLLLKNIDNNLQDIKNHVNEIDDLSTSIDNMTTSIDNMIEEINMSMNVQLSTSVDYFDKLTDTDIVITGNSNKICDTITLKLDGATIGSYSNVNSFIKNYTIQAEDVDTHIILAEFSKDNKTFSIAKILIAES